MSIIESDKIKSRKKFGWKLAMLVMILSVAIPVHASSTKDKDRKSTRLNSSHP